MIVENTSYYQARNDYFRCHLISDIVVNVKNSETNAKICPLR